MEKGWIRPEFNVQVLKVMMFLPKSFYVFLLLFRFVFNGKFKSGDQVEDDHFQILDLARDVDKGVNPHP